MSPSEFELGQLVLDEPIQIDREAGLYLRLAMRYLVDPPVAGREQWTARVAGYLFDLVTKDHRMICSYHWHPEGRSSVHTSHLHVGCRAGNADLSKVHLPSGPVTLVDVIRCAISEFGAKPRRRDWHDVLAQCQAILTIQS